jgi:hypothetical protein
MTLPGLISVAWNDNQSSNLWTLKDLTLGLAFSDVGPEHELSKFLALFIAATILMMTFTPTKYLLDSPPWASSMF